MIEFVSIISVKGVFVVDYSEKIQYKRDNIRIFCDYMLKKAEEIGISKDTFFNDPCGGRKNVTTARDFLRWLIKGYETKKLWDIWSVSKLDVALRGENARVFPLVSTVFSDPSSHLLTDHYEILGGKTGSMTKLGVLNLAVIAKIPDSNDLAACVCLYADEINDLPKNRFQAAKEALDAAVKKYKNRSLDVSKESVCADSVIVCVVPEKAEDYHENLDILYEKNADSIKMPASTTKIFTAALGLELLENLDEEITIVPEDIDSLPDNFYGDDILPGDVLTIKELMYFMMLPSSNAASFIFAGLIAEKFLR